MFITMEAKENKVYELQDDHVEEIHEAVKEDIINALSKYESSYKDLIIASFALANIAKGWNEILAGKLSPDQIIELSGMKEVEK